MPQRFALLAVLSSTLLAGCGAKEQAPTAAQLDAWRPSDQRLAAIYSRSCVLCHGQPNSGAPSTGFVSAWAPRLKQAGGLDGLVASARRGKGAMPPMGMCTDCNDADLHALIDFMSSKKP